MGKKLAFLGLAMAAVGLVLGLAQWGGCGSAFGPPDVEPTLMGDMTGPDCSTALGLSAPLKLLVVVGVIVAVASAVNWYTTPGRRARAAVARQSDPTR